MRRPLFWCAVAAALGTLAGMRLSGRFTVAILIAAIILALATAWIRPKGAALTAALMAAAMLLFAARTAYVWDLKLPPEGEYSIQGIVQQPRLTENGRHAAVQLRNVILKDGSGGEYRLDGLYWTAYVPEDYALPEPGRTVRLVGRMYEPGGRRNPDGFDFRLYLRQNHMSAGFYNSGEYETVADAPFSVRSFLIKTRYALLERLDQAFGERSALPKALLLGERDALSEEDRAAFARVGIAHVLAVSGLHISLIVAALGLIVRRFMSGRKQLWLFGAFLLVYAVLLDLRASVVRASILTFVYLFVRARGRSSDPLSALSLAFMIILMLSPVDLLNAGFQLSFAAVLGIVMLYRPFHRVTAKLLGRKAGSLLASTLSAITGTALPSIQTFHCFSLAGLVFSPVVCALLMYVLPFCLLTLVLSFVWMDAAQWLAFPVGWVLQLMSDGVAAAAQWPFMSVNCPSVPWSFYPVAAAGIWLFSAYAPARFRGRRRLVILAVLFAAGTAIHLCTIDNRVSYLQLDVGSADCAVIQDGWHTTVVDCGEDGRDLCAYLLARGRMVNTLVLTHLHTDHCLGAQNLMDDGIPIDRLILPAGAEQMAVSEEALDLLERLKTYSTETVTVSAGDGWETDRTGARVLWPEKDGIRTGKDANNYCLCLEYRLGDTALLLTGDLTGAYEPYIHAKADVLKVAHHGSRTSSTQAFLDSVSPSTAIISVSGNGDTAGSADEVRNRLMLAGADVYTTAECGAIRIESCPGGYRVIRFIKEGAP